MSGDAGRRDAAIDGASDEHDNDNAHMDDDVARGGVFGVLTAAGTSTPSSTTHTATSGRTPLPSSAQLQLRRSESGTGTGVSLSNVLLLPDMVMDRPCRPLPRRPKLVKRPPHVGIKERFNDVDASLSSLGLS